MDAMQISRRNSKDAKFVKNGKQYANNLMFGIFEILCIALHVTT